MSDYVVNINKVNEINEERPISQPVPHPWRRYFARHIDLMFYGIIWTFIELFILRLGTEQGVGQNLMSLLISIGLMLLIEPILLMTAGTTLGKWLFGLRVRDLNGDKLSHREGFERTWSIIKVGMGFGIPFYTLYRSYKSYSTCKDRRLCEWELDYSYKIKDTKVWRIIAYIIAFAVIIGITMLAVTYSRLPVNKGRLTAEAFYENYNDMMKYNDIDYGYVLNSNGEWVEAHSDSSTITIHLTEPVEPSFQLVELDGDIKEVTMTIESKDVQWVWGYGDYIYLAYMSYVGAQKGINPIRIIDRELADLIDTGNESFSVIREDIIITSEVTYEGYEDAGSMLIAKDDQDQTYTMVFKMRKR